MGEWLPRHWVAGAALTAAAVGGLLIARDATGGAVYWRGLAVFGVCVLGVFIAIADYYEPLPFAKLKSMPDGGARRYAVGGLVGALGIFGLFRAQSGAAVGDYFSYGDGLGLAAAAVAYIFLLIKDWFDRSQTAEPDSPPGPSGGPPGRA